MKFFPRNTEDASKGSHLILIRLYIYLYLLKSFKIFPRNTRGAGKGINSNLLTKYNKYVYIDIYNISLKFFPRNTKGASKGSRLSLVKQL